MTAETFIHPTALVEPGAQLGVGVRVGAFCCIGPDAEIGDGVELMNNVTIMGATTLGSGCKVFPQAVLGAPPQNAKHKGGRTTLIVGRNTTIREGVTMHTGTDTSRGETRVGENGNFLAYTHIAHDCIVGDNVTFANLATLGGHVEVGNNVIIGGLTAVHQFVRIGDNAFVGGACGVAGDVIPFGMAEGNKASLRGFNIIGMKRAGIPRQEIYTLRAAYRALFDEARPVSENVERVRTEFSGSPTVLKIVDFITARGKRHFVVPPRGKGRDAGADVEDV
ncbi:acyl-ACP--UDP-N-acetylglucosamine O-acyltransferase [Arvimicrobium flavum]|uniref:acyl-ACP--UDP-N-acetylglucosamine O-acyltransferase n=1 Tax=Arvimicrobium flavum TaxID=3393320 RepID=UPI00237B2A77|nr:acyl-ACP--UDP-N-acetylglucosamine O-acyltransferase [Mesorhizobium shangrilense]